MILSMSFIVVQSMKSSLAVPRFGFMFSEANDDDLRIFFSNTLLAKGFTGSFTSYSTNSEW